MGYLSENKIDIIPYLYDGLVESHVPNFYCL